MASPETSLGAMVVHLEDEDDGEEELVIQQTHHLTEVEEQSTPVHSSVSPKKKAKIYPQKFRNAWMKMPNFKGWLKPGSAIDKAYCTMCQTELTAGKSELLKHMQAKKHIRRKERKEQQLEGSLSTDLANVLEETGITHTLYIVDLRSDTVTQPCREMKKMMMSTALGDDRFGEDPTVKTLEEKVAELLGKEAGLFLPSGTMANLVCVLTHCWGRGSEVIMGDKSFLWDHGGIAQVGSVHHKAIENLPDGTFSLDELRSLVSVEEKTWPITTLVCVENTNKTMGGKALPQDWVNQLGMLCREFNLLLHMDGARLMNASVALGMPPIRLVQHCDSVSFCLNKGLGAPAGSVIVGSKDFIARASCMRKVLGGGLHQVGILAAAGLYALSHTATKLSLDHAHARAIAQCVCDEHSTAVTVDLRAVQTNIILLNCDNIRVNAKKLCQRLSLVTDNEASELGEHIVVMVLPVSETTVRLMTHHDVRKEDIKAVIKKLKYVIQEYDNCMYVQYKIDVPTAVTSV
ncbi:uncharacterized protein LOC143021229 [Oratosquilla oratoria]|uniref:uncharacterized protein LOC143021229 n=1 Tax=Oratosquilla oratoria TaxID=337810 RepID=UPI003F75A8CF